MFGTILKNKAFTLICLASILVLYSDFCRPAWAEEDSSKDGVPGRREGGGTRLVSPIKDKFLIGRFPNNIKIKVDTSKVFVYTYPSQSTLLRINN